LLIPQWPPSTALHDHLLKVRDTAVKKDLEGLIKGSIESQSFLTSTTPMTLGAQGCELGKESGGIEGILEQVDKRFNHLESEIRELRSEISSLRGEISGARSESGVKSVR